MRGAAANAAVRHAAIAPTDVAVDRHQADRVSQVDRLVGVLAGPCSASRRRTCGTISTFTRSVYAPRVERLAALLLQGRLPSLERYLSSPLMTR